jgi:histidyl-tRNA synthetase
MADMDHNLRTAQDIGEMKADMRTVKHDISNVQQQLQSIDRRLNTINTSQARGLGFFAGVAFILTGAGGLLLALGKLIWGDGA